MTTEEKLNTLIDTVQNFTEVMLGTLQGIATIVRSNNESSEPEKYNIDGQEMTLTEYQNLITKRQLDLQMEEVKAREQALALEAEKLKNLENLAKEMEDGK